VSFDGSEIGVFDSNSQVVNGVPDNESHLSGNLREIIRSGVLDSLSASNIQLYAGSVGIRQRIDTSFQIRNVFISPSNFEPCSGESIYHVTDSIEPTLG